MPEKTTTPPPMTARLEGPWSTHTDIVLEVFGKALRYTVRDHNHATKAQAMVDEWNAHFEREYDKVQQTSAAIMCRFEDALKAQGVADDVIQKAMVAVVEYAEG